mgnify:CR=1 FL=1
MALSVARNAGRQAPSKITVPRILMWTALILTTLISLFPMYWMFVTAFTPTQDTIKTPPDLFPHADLSNFERLFSSARDYWSWFANSVIITLGITFFHLIFDTLSGYAFAKKKFPGRNILFWIIISTLMIPPQVTLVPLYIVVQNFNLRDSLWAVILPGWANVFGIFLMRQYIQTLPTELEEAGRIDGCSELAAIAHGPGGAGDIHFRALLERLYVAEHAPHQERVLHPAGWGRQFADGVLDRLRPHFCRVGGGGAADDCLLPGFPEIFSRGGPGRGS